MKLIKMLVNYGLILLVIISSTFYIYHEMQLIKESMWKLGCTYGGLSPTACESAFNARSK